MTKDEARRCLELTREKFKAYTDKESWVLRYAGPYFTVSVHSKTTVVGTSRSYAQSIKGKSDLKSTKLNWSRMGMTMIFIQYTLKHSLSTELNLRS